MKVKLHNKIEIIQGDKCCVVYNTMLKSVYPAIAEMKNYFSRVAVGTGQGDSMFSNTSLEGFVSSHELVTEEVCCNIGADELFVKKSVTFGENEYNGLTFSELGITDQETDNPTIYNRVVIKNSEGAPLTVTKRDGEALTIRITIYLVIDENSKKYFTLGDNPLLLQMMGEDAANDKTVYAIRGTDYTGFDEPIVRAVPNGKLTKCTLQQSGEAETGFSFDIIASLGLGDAREIVFVYADKAVMRVDVTSFANSFTEYYIYGFDSQGFFNITKEHVTGLELGTTTDGTAIDMNGIENIRVAHRCGESVKIVPSFDSQVPGSESDVMVAPDGKSFTFGLNGNVFNGVFTADKTGIVCKTFAGIHTNNYRIAKFYNGALFFFNYASLMFGFFDIVGSGNGEKQIDSSDMKKSYDFSTITDFECLVNTSGHLLLGMVLSLSSGKKVGVVGVYEKVPETGGYVFSKAIETSIDGVEKVKAYPAEFGGEGSMLFFANQNETTTSALECEIVSENASQIIEDKTVAEFAFRDDLVGIDTAKDLLLFKLGSESYNGMVVYDLTRKAYTGYKAKFGFKVNCDISRDGKYFAEYAIDTKEYSRLLYRKYYDDFGEFEEGAVKINSDIKKVILTKDLIVFLKYDSTLEKYYFEAYTYDETYNVLYSESNKNISSTGTITYINPLGDGEFEGVEVKFSLHLAPPVGLN